jgi:hypothetical protein
LGLPARGGRRGHTSDGRSVRRQFAASHA